MKFYLDENFSPYLLQAISAIYDDHEFRSWKDEGLCGVLDVELFRVLRERTFDAIVTRDRRQLRDAQERAALLDSNLIWVGLRDVSLSGREKLSTTIASLMAGLGHVIADVRTTPVSYLIYNVPHGRTQRLKSFPLLR